MDDDAKKRSAGSEFARNVGESFKEGWRPNFQNDTTGKEKDKKSKRQEERRESEDAKQDLSAAESSAAGGGLYRGGGSVREGEEDPGVLNYTGVGKKRGGKQKGKFGAMKGTAVVAVFLLILVLVVVVALSTPIFQIGNIDFNLMDALGFLGTVGILENQAEYVIGDEMAHGEVPDKLAGKLASHGLMVGQVAANGDFVRTNVYVANADELKDLAVLGNFQVQPSEGELAILYEGDVIGAHEFAETVEANPVMYAAYSEAIDIGALYYYESKDVQEAFDTAKLSRSWFSGWEDTGNDDKNRENFLKILEDNINNFSDLQVGMGGTTTVTDANGNQTTETIDNGVTVSGKDNAAAIVDDVAGDTRYDTKKEATERAAQLLNTAISAGEPYLAMADFLAIEEPIQQTRVDGGDGVVHELMGVLYEENEISYIDVHTGEEKKTSASVLTTPNFVAAVSSGIYSSYDAANFSRDRALLATGTSNDGVVQDTVIKTKGQEESKMVLRVTNQEEADKDALRIVDDSVQKAMVDKNSDLFATEVGGNRAVSGGAELSRRINRMAVGAMGSDAETVAAYHQEVKEVLARKAEAERATKSPFDISSPYTFLGSVARSLANATIQSRASGGGSSVVGTIANLTSDSVKGAYNAVVADGDDGSYEMAKGEHCDTVWQAAKVEGDIYCSAKTTISTKYMKRGKDDWGDIGESKGYKNFVTIGTDRQSTIGVRSADVCEKYKEENPDLFRDIADVFAGWLGIYEACGGVDYNIALGANYTFSDGNNEGDRKDAEKYGGYMLYDQVSSLLEGGSTAATRIREEYYAEHPRDESRAGQLAQISGMTKAEAEVALAYADYLTYLAQYDPSTRYAFGELKYEKPEGPLVDYANQVAVELYVMWHGRTEYDDLRGRIRVV